MKIVRINFCEECPSFEFGFCYKTPKGLDRRKIENEDVIPEWCPLDDVEPEPRGTIFKLDDNIGELC